MYFPTSMLMALHEERAGGFDRRAFQAGLGSLEPWQARSSRARPWPIRAFATLSGRSQASARGAGLDYCLIDTSRPLDEALREYLAVRKGKM